MKSRAVNSGAIGQHSIICSQVHPMPERLQAVGIVVIKFDDYITTCCFFVGQTDFCDKVKIT